MHRPIRLVFCLYFFLHSTVLAAGLKPGDTAPLFSLTETTGKTFTLQEQLTHGHVMLIFWELECVYCYSHIKDFNALAERYQGRLKLAGINFLGEYADDVAQYAKDNNVHYTLLADRLKNIDVAEAYKIIGSPTMVLIDPQGKILYYGHQIPELAKWIR